MIGNNIDIHVHAYDRNATINKYIQDNHPNVVNANDTVHLAKGILKEIKRIGSGRNTSMRRPGMASCQTKQQL